MSPHMKHEAFQQPYIAFIVLIQYNSTIETGRQITCPWTKIPNWPLNIFISVSWLPERNINRVDTWLSVCSNTAQDGTWKCFSNCRTTTGLPLGPMWEQLEMLCLEIFNLVCRTGPVTRGSNSAPTTRTMIITKATVRRKTKGAGGSTSMRFYKESYKACSFIMHILKYMQLFIWIINGDILSSLFCPSPDVTQPIWTACTTTVGTTVHRQMMVWFGTRGEDGGTPWRPASWSCGPQTSKSTQSTTPMPFFALHRPRSDRAAW